MEYKGIFKIIITKFVLLRKQGIASNNGPIVNIKTN